MSTKGSFLTAVELCAISNKGRKECYTDIVSMHAKRLGIAPDTVLQAIAGYPTFAECIRNSAIARDFATGS